MNTDVLCKVLIIILLVVFATLLLKCFGVFGGALGGVMGGALIGSLKSGGSKNYTGGNSSLNATEYTELEELIKDHQTKLNSWITNKNSSIGLALSNITETNLKNAISRELIKRQTNLTGKYKAISGKFNDTGKVDKKIPLDNSFYQSFKTVKNDLDNIKTSLDKYYQDGVVKNLEGLIKEMVNVQDKYLRENGPPIGNVKANQILTNALNFKPLGEPNTINNTINSIIAQIDGLLKRIPDNVSAYKKYMETAQARSYDIIEWDSSGETDEIEKVFLRGSYPGQNVNVGVFILNNRVENREILNWKDNNIEMIRDQTDNNKWRVQIRLADISKGMDIMWKTYIIYKNKNKDFAKISDIKYTFKTPVDHIEEMKTKPSPSPPPGTPYPPPPMPPKKPTPPPVIKFAGLVKYVVPDIDLALPVPPEPENMNEILSARYTPAWSKLHSVVANADRPNGEGYTQEFIDKIKFVVLHRIKTKYPWLYPPAQEKLALVNKKMADDIGGNREQAMLEKLLNDFLDYKGVVPTSFQRHSSIQRFMQLLSTVSGDQPIHKLVSKDEINNIEAVFAGIKATL